MGLRPVWRRMLLVGVPQLLAVVPAVVTMLVVWDRLPEPMATRFAFDGAVSDQMSRSALLLTMIALGLVLSVGLGLAYRTAGDPRANRISRWDVPRLFVAFSWAVAGLLGVVLVMVVASNTDAVGAATVTMPAVELLYAVAAAVVAGAVGALLAPRSEAAPLDEDEPPAMELAPGEHVSWTRPISSPWLTILGLALLVVGVVLGWSAGWVTGGPFLVAGLLVGLLSRATVTVDQRGTTVRFTPLGWPRVRIDLGEIESAVAENISPAQFGGWGYRIVPGASGLVLRAGPGLILTRRTGRKFVVTVDDAETAARVLNGLRARR